MEAATAGTDTPIIDPSRARSEFENVSPGQCGAVVIENGKSRGIAVMPGARIWLTREEQTLTANAPKFDKNNPFTSGVLKLVTSAQDIGNRRPIGDPALGNSPAGEAAERARADAERDKAAAEAKAQAVRDQQAEGQQQAARGSKPATTVRAKTEGEGAAPLPEPPDEPEETAATPEPGGQASQGQRAATEEVATPSAVPEGGKA